MAQLPTHVEVGGWIRQIQHAGGFATLINRGEKDAGTVIILTTCRGKNSALWERMPQLDGSRKFVETRQEEAENPAEFMAYIQRRITQDPDLWVLEIDHEDSRELFQSLVN